MKFHALRSRWVIAAAALLPSVALGLVVACNLGEIDDLTNGVRDSGAVDTGPLEVPDADTCEHDVPPPKPNIPDGEEGLEVVFAFAEARLDTPIPDSGLPRPLGIDLDRTCSCEPSARVSCIRPKGAGCNDDPRGRDNVLGTVLTSALGTGSDPDAVRTHIRSGEYSILIRLRGWNGQPDDPKVSVELMSSSGIDLPEGGVRGDSGIVPVFNGSDSWSIDEKTLLNPKIGSNCTINATCSGLTATDDAYVSRGTLVARLEGPLFLDSPLGRVLGHFRGQLVADLAPKTPGGKDYELNGQLVSRGSASELLTALRDVRVFGTKKSLCPGTLEQGYIRAKVCANLDIMADETEDGTGKPCDALSNSLGFRASIAKLGRVVPSLPADSDCPDATDSCF